MRIECVVDELVLIGFEPRRRHAIADAVQHALEAHITRHDVMPMVRAGRDVPLLRAEAPTRDAGALRGTSERFGSSLSTSSAGALPGAAGTQTS